MNTGWTIRQVRAPLSSNIPSMLTCVLWALTPGPTRLELAATFSLKPFTSPLAWTRKAVERYTSQSCMSGRPERRESRSLALSRNGISRRSRQFIQRNANWRKSIP